MDDVDRKIMAILRDNARESFTNMAEMVGTSEGTVRARVKRLMDDGVIRKFTIRTAGSNVKALIEVSVTNNVNTADVAAKIRAWDGVESVWEVTGENDIVVVADCPNTSDLNGIIDKIREVPGTQATRSRLILKEHG
jgi:DNA-binding Lrp family transcriptional regulator